MVKHPPPKHGDLQEEVFCTLFLLRLVPSINDSQLIELALNIGKNVMEVDYDSYTFESLNLSVVC